jgi:hypothetical protein
MKSGFVKSKKNAKEGYPIIIFNCLKSFNKFFDGEILREGSVIKFNTKSGDVAKLYSPSFSNIL